MGSALAIREETTQVEGTPTDENGLIGELRDLTRELNVRQRLRSWTNAIKQLRRRNTSDAKWLLLVLDLPANTISVTGYVDRRKASEELAQIEQSSRRAELDAVLVWVGSIKNLKRAYPNYYADTGEFLEALNVALRPLKTSV